MQGVFVNGYKNAGTYSFAYFQSGGSCDSGSYFGTKMTEEKIGTHGGKRKGAGRPKGNDATKKFSISARMSEYALIAKAAASEGKSISRYLVELALQKSR